MTEPTEGQTAPDADQLARVAALRSRRADAAASKHTSAERSTRRRRHVAQGSRVLAAGLGATTMLGIVTVLGLDHPVSGADESNPTTVPTPTVPQVIAAPPVQIVIHRVPASSVPTTTGAATASTSPLTPVAPVAPVQLTANPVVQTVTVAAPSQQRSSSPAVPAPAPAATTSGSG